MSSGQGTPLKKSRLEFFSSSRSRAGFFASQPVETHRETAPTPTIIVSGMSCWLSRDPIGDLGGLNVYCFVLNDSVDNIDAYGLQSACSWAVGKCVRNVGNVDLPAWIPQRIRDLANQAIPDHHDVKVESYYTTSCDGIAEETIVNGFFADDFYVSVLKYALSLIPFSGVDGWVPGGVKDASKTAGTCSLSCVSKARFDQVKNRMTTSTASRYHLEEYTCQTWAAEQLQ